ncbi:serine hydrolase domain-containing protein [Microvirga brassicacearum]|uniref:Beta-lactamase family protein n=1 Tax=Microvirga brassicacearum TaxID=2580413 RepID=A0A5N3PB54_9HYPH|nr:serine hydrolase domain-containing protein [Microvirga brassicacearum]KAB0266924.1 beta-lactamase family protein [Microvirga brassicacearum]
MSVSQSAVVTEEGELEERASTAIVPWWSFTKALIAAGVLRLAEQGRVDLDRPIRGQSYTLRAILQHRSGIGDYSGLAEYHEAVAKGDDPWSDEALFERVSPEAFLFRPMSGWAYSNVGYLLLRRMIERTCGTGLPQALHELVLEPLDLRHSRVAETREDMRATIFDTGRPYHPGWAFHGIVIGPVAEAALALHRLMQGDLLTPASRAAMLNAHAIGGALPGRPWLTTGYGLGLMSGTMQRVGMARPLHVIGHSAGGPASTGAVYCASQDGYRRTVAVFGPGSNEGAAEDQALRLLARM